MTFSIKKTINYNVNQFISISHSLNLTKDAKNSPYKGCFYNLSLDYIQLNYHRIIYLPFARFIICIT
ncbi:hypothetical protein SARI_00874 [Salmonella enterica subsp. arizonae serovar 62:z4,z23:-]|uniref:Uncharacterized protein n=1 Tax=Salmonella arizonae (strain ATCC BAA-731 / CDC346-86 / RSK2980) TaxID=41514 RepID=A9MLT0_SALAR|nr:hypothetical protein SARI_00874 [Salmonella enterica subsp. arizonae serovar 62:z4,z23:-]